MGYALKFGVGDIVRKKHGKNDIEITNISDSSYNSYNGRYHVTGRYVVSNNPVYGYDKEFVLSSEQGVNKMGKAKLYQVKKEPERFGVELAVNSQGQLVLDMKDTKTTELFNKTEVEVVTPFTFEVQHVGRNNTQTFIGTDSIKVGDILMAEGTPTLMQVTKVNTKSEKALKEFKGRRLLTEAV